MNNYYLKSEAERIIHDLGYECDEHDIETVAKMFDENYNSFSLNTRFGGMLLTNIMA